MEAFAFSLELYVLQPCNLGLVGTGLGAFQAVGESQLPPNQPPASPWVPRLPMGLGSVSQGATGSDLTVSWVEHSYVRASFHTATRHPQCPQPAKWGGAGRGELAQVAELLFDPQLLWLCCLCSWPPALQPRGALGSCFCGGRGMSDPLWFHSGCCRAVFSTFINQGDSTLYMLVCSLLFSCNSPSRALCMKCYIFLTYFFLFNTVSLSLRRLVGFFLNPWLYTQNQHFKISERTVMI